MKNFVADLNHITRIREQAMRALEDGAVTPANDEGRSHILKMLESALATEWICVLRYSQHAAVASGIHGAAVAEHFQEHADEELKHAHMLAKRIQQLGGTPTLEPTKLKSEAHSYYKECSSLTEMIKENLIAERIAVISYSEMIQAVGNKDVTTRRLFEHILATEEEHADEMAELLTAFDPREPLN